MAQTATIYTFSIDLSDMDRGVFETLSLRVARHPSETVEYMVVRVLAYCLEFQDGIELTEGVSSGDEPALLVRDLTGRTTAWIEVGMPDANRLHRGMKLAGRVAVYTHRDTRQLLGSAGRRQDPSRRLRSRSARSTKGRSRRSARYWIGECRWPSRCPGATSTCRLASRR